MVAVKMSSQAKWSFDVQLPDVVSLLRPSMELPSEPLSFSMRVSVDFSFRFKGSFRRNTFSGSSTFGNNS